MAPSKRNRAPVNPDAQYLVRKLVALDPELASYPWIWERRRWAELIFALLTETVEAPERLIRDLVENLMILGLLQPTDLVAQAHSKGIIDLFLEYGFSEEDAQRAIAVMRDASKGLAKKFMAKVQLYLRHYGSLMLEDVDKLFSFTTLTKEQVRQAFTYWLQNALMMPVPLYDSMARDYCDRLGLSPADLFAAADDLDINVAVIDDAIHSYVTRILVATGAPNTRVLRRHPKSRR